jgi:7-cyano-7-deazaguanine synthase
MKMPSKSAIILLSGGLDSATTLAIAKYSGYDCYAITFRYGQRHTCEIEAAQKVAQSLSVKAHKVVSVDLAAFGGSALTDDHLAVPKDREGITTEIPITYVPARNTVFLSYALAWAEVLGVWDIFIGVNAVDYSGYPDCRPAFIRAFETMANLATAKAVQGQGTYCIQTPIIEMTKAQIIRMGVKLGVDYSLTHSCYDPVSGRPCGHCDSCRLRLKGFQEAGLTDPVHYA